jgi:hypothetical protein
VLPSGRFVIEPASLRPPGVAMERCESPRLKLRLEPEPSDEVRGEPLNARLLLPLSDGRMNWREEEPLSPLKERDERPESPLIERDERPESPLKDRDERPESPLIERELCPPLNERDDLDSPPPERDDPPLNEREEPPLRSPPPPLEREEPPRSPPPPLIERAEPPPRSPPPPPPPPRPPRPSRWASTSPLARRTVSKPATTVR